MTLYEYLITANPFPSPIREDHTHVTNLYALRSVSKPNTIFHSNSSINFADEECRLAIEQADKWMEATIALHVHFMLYVQRTPGMGKDTSATELNLSHPGCHSKFPQSTYKWNVPLVCSYSVNSSENRVAARQT
jgi:hypothetical protein